MAEVFLARELALDRVVALKLMSAPGNDTRARERFLGEAQALARLSHPNVASVFRIDELPDGRPFIAYEYVRGASLDHIVLPMPWQSAVSILSPLAHALAAVHSAELVHRDIKPENVVLALSGDVKLIDFGLAIATKSLEREPSDGPSGARERVEEDSERSRSGPRLTRPGVAVGTPRYWAPEQWNGHPASPASDVYAFGLIAYEILMGRLPYDDLVGGALADALNREEIAPLTSDVAPQALIEIVARCLKRAPSARYASGVELKGAFQVIQSLLSTPLHDALDRRPALGIQPHSDARVPSSPSRPLSSRPPAGFSPPVERAETEPLAPPRPLHARVRGASVAYQAFGRGPPNLVLLPGAMTHIAATWTHPAPIALLTELASFSRVVIFDHRGSGFSDPLDEPPSLGASVEDILGVMSAAAMERAIVVAASEAALSALSLAAMRPERVQGLVLFGAGATFAELDDREAPLEDVWDHLDSWFPKHWGDPTLAALETPTASSDPEYLAWFTQYHLLAATPRRAAATLRAMRDTEDRGSMSRVRAPTLVLRRAGDAVVSAPRAEALAARIPGARYAETGGDDHFLFSVDGPALAREIQLFAASLRETELPM